MISTNSVKILCAASKIDLNNHRKRISENNNAIINEEISLSENLENQDLSMKTKMDSADVYGKGDVILYDNGLQRMEEDQDQSDDVKLGLELTPDEQAERVNLFLLGFASIILMNAMAVLIIVIAKNSNYEDQMVIKSSINKRPIKGRDLMTPFFQLKVRAWLEKPYFYLVHSRKNHCAHFNLIFTTTLVVCFHGLID